MEDNKFVQFFLLPCSKECKVCLTPTGCCRAAETSFMSRILLSRSFSSSSHKIIVILCDFLFVLISFSFFVNYLSFSEERLKPNETRLSCSDFQTLILCRTRLSLFTLSLNSVQFNATLKLRDLRRQGRMFKSQINTSSPLSSFDSMVRQHE